MHKTHNKSYTTGTDCFLWFTFVLQSLCLSLWWSLCLSLRSTLVRCLHQNLWQCLRILDQVRWFLWCFVLPVCFRLCVSLQCLTFSLRGWIWARVAFIAQIPHLQESLHQTLDKFCWTCLWAIVETGHREDNVVWLRVVTHSISIWNNGSIAAEHLNSSRDLREESVLQCCTYSFTIVLKCCCRVLMSGNYASKTKID